MNEAILRVNNIPIYGFGVLAVFSFLWGSFVYYKRSNESNLDEKLIFDSIVLSAFWSFIVGRLAYSFINVDVFWNHWSRLFLLTNYPGLDRFGVVFGIAFGLWLSLRKSKGKFFDWFDLIAIGISSGTAVFLAGLAVLTFSWQFILLSTVYLVVFLLFWAIEGKYRTYEWYRNKKTSAKSGLISGLSMSCWAVLFLFERILMNNFIWQVGVWSGVLFVGGLVLVYIRSGRTVAEDIKIVFKHGKR